MGHLVAGRRARDDQRAADDERGREGRARDGRADHGRVQRLGGGEGVRVAGGGQSLAGGAVALAPAGPVGAAHDYGWWTVGPDGAVRDEMQNGGHQIPGYIEDLMNAIKQSPRIRRIRCAVAGAAIAAGVLAMVVDKGPELQEATEQTAEAIDHLARYILDKENEFDEVEETCEALGGGPAALTAPTSNPF